ncbi:uncharacterized protein LOC128861326 [Anastrepha ludens]|uniref:uncharacterized protein LOC128861326 n=1 Tax=Anastrepha ludens TaxID=28586 RepID=UPI0023B2034E|nr:uncharacterized protein LOC128861326 [Anastrepha ludens]
MVSNKCIFFYITLFSSLYTLGNTHPLLKDDNYAAVYLVDGQKWPEEYPIVELVRHARSPSSSEESSQENKRGRVELKYENTPERGREATLKYNHNLLRSDDDSYSIDAYAQGRRNYDWNQNDFHGGLEGRWNFKG